MALSTWFIEKTNNADKQFKKLPNSIKVIIFALINDLSYKGPLLPEWPRFSKLNGDNYHCHLKRGRPTYVKYQNYL